MASTLRFSKIGAMCAVASATALMSEDPHVKVGTVALRKDWTVIGTGYNGLAPGTELTEAQWQDRDFRRGYIIHAEVNAMRYARPNEVYGIVTTHIPCISCISMLGSYGVTVVYYIELLDGDVYDIDAIHRVARHNGIMLVSTGDDK